MAMQTRHVRLRTSACHGELDSYFEWVTSRGWTIVSASCSCENWDIVVRGETPLSPTPRVYREIAKDDIGFSFAAPTWKELVELWREVVGEPMPDNGHRSRMYQLLTLIQKERKAGPCL